MNGSRKLTEASRRGGKGDGDK